MSSDKSPQSPITEEKDLSFRLYIDGTRIRNFKKIILEDVQKIDIRPEAVFIESKEFLSSQMIY